MVKGMKHTEIGLIPDDWEVKTIDELAQVKSGKRLPLGNSLSVKETPYPYIRVADMVTGNVLLDNIMYVPINVYPRIKNYRIFIDDIFISVAGTLGVVGFIPKKLDGANLTENANRLSEIKCNKEYLFHILNSSLIQNKINSEKTLGAQPKLALTRIRKFIIPLPKKRQEQVAIAKVLDDIDDSVIALKKLIAKKKAIRTGSIQQLLIPERDWIEYNLGEDATLKARIGWQGLTKSEYKNTGDFYLVTGTDFLNGNIDWENCVYVKEHRYSQDKNIQLKINDVLVTKDGTIGKVAFVRELKKPTTLNSGVFVVRPINNSFDSKFFFYILSSNIFKDFLDQLSAGSTINHLYQKDFVTFKFFAPKEIKEQKRIAQILSDMDEEVLALEVRLKKQEQLKEGMMQMLLTGKIRLI